MNTINRALREVFWVRRDAIDIAHAALSYFGVVMSPDLYEKPDVRAVLISDAVNLAAKTINPFFYEIKEECVIEAFNTPGVEGGWGEDDAFYLYAKGAGTQCFHFPDGVSDNFPKSKWDKQWTGIYRQDIAFEIISNPKIRKAISYLTDKERSPDWLDRTKRNMAGPVGRLP